jgi:hypothetical protein
LAHVEGEKTWIFALWCCLWRKEAWCEILNADSMQTAPNRLTNQTLLNDKKIGAERDASIHLGCDDGEKTWIIPLFGCKRES